MLRLLAPAARAAPDRRRGPETSRAAALSSRAACHRRRGPACRAPRSRLAASAAQSRYAETLADCQGSMTSIRWCGIPPRSGKSRLGRRDIHTAVQGHRVERDHLGIEPPRQRHADGRLARGRRPRQIDRAMKQIWEHRFILSISYAIHGQKKAAGWIAPERRCRIRRHHVSVCIDRDLGRQM